MNDPNAAKRLTWGSEKATCVIAKTDGMTIAALTDRFTTRKSGSLDLSHPTTPAPWPLGDGADVSAARVMPVLSLTPWRGRLSLGR